MRDAYELTRDGPYVRVVLPDVLPPDWDALERDLGDEVEDGATRITLMAQEAGALDTHSDRLDAICASLDAGGIETVIIWPDDDRSPAPAYLMA